MTTPEDQTQEGKPVMAEETQELTAPEAPELDAAAITRAYARLPLLSEVHDHLLAEASRYGHPAASQLTVALQSLTKGASGVRVYNSLDGVPAFYPGPKEWRHLNTKWVADYEALNADEFDTLGGLLWPYPDGTWQYIHIMANGTYRNEVVGRPEETPAPVEEPENWTASKADDVEMVVAYAALPTLPEVLNYMAAQASRFGVDAAYKVKAYLVDQADNGALGVRVFTKHRTVPIFTPPASEVRDQVEWANPADVVQGGVMQTIGGLIWPLPGGNWQYVYLRTDGGTMTESVSTAAPAPEPVEEPLSAERYTDDKDLLYLSKEFVRVGVGVASHLRDAANKVERHARNVRPNLSDLKLDHNYAASEVLHDINTLLGNLNTSGLLTAAADADRHARNPEA